MKKGIQIILMPALVLILANCSNNSSAKTVQTVVADTSEVSAPVAENADAGRKNQDLELVKGLSVGRANVYAAMNAIAGVTGDVNWTISYPDKYKKNPNLFVAEGRAVNEERQRDIYLRLLVNRKTGEAEFQSATKNGREMEGLQLPTILEQAVENGYY